VKVKLEETRVEVVKAVSELAIVEERLVEDSSRLFEEMKKVLG
jgi:hypothetical protein